MRSFIRRIMSAEKGATAVEYALIISLIVLGMVGGLSELASSTFGLWNHVATEATNH